MNNEKIKKKPEFVFWLLKRLMPKQDFDPLFSNFECLYEDIYYKKGKIFAQLWIWNQFFRSLPGLFSAIIYWRFIMFKSYVKIAVRNIKQYKAYSFINILGLSVGMACFILIMMWVKDEVSYNHFHKDIENLYLVAAEHHTGDSIFRGAATPAPLAEALLNDFPEIGTTTSFANSWITGNNQNLVNYKNNKFYLNDLILADESFFKIFSFKFIEGDPEYSLKNPTDIVLTESIVKRYFGNEDPINKTLEIDGTMFSVTAVVEDVPENSSIQFEAVISKKYAETLPNAFFLRKWDSYGFSTYLQLRRGVNVEEVNSKISDYIIKTDPKWAHRPTHLYLYPFKDVRLHNLNGGGLITYVYIFSIIAVLVLLIACINYTNLATARSLRRIREIGMRKVSGSNRNQLIYQFMGESVIYSLFGLFSAVILVTFLLPVFNGISGKNLSIEYSNFGNVSVLILIALITGLISGSYPAIFLSSFNPVNIFRNVAQSGRGSALFRKVLVVTQFTISIGLMICMVVVINQLSFMKNSEIGFDKENVLFIPLKGKYQENYETIKNELLKGPDIINASTKSTFPTFSGSTSGTISWEGKNPDLQIAMSHPMVDFDYFSTLNMEIIEGRDFSKDITSDIREAFIINEKVVEIGGIKDPVGKQIMVNGGSGKIIGVVKNAQLNSLRFEASPEIYHLSRTFTERFQYLLVKIGAGNTQDSGERISETLSFIENKWKEIVPEYPFEYNFLDEAIENQYLTEMRISRIVNYFTFIAVFLSCLGLFGLASFMMERRTKEIAIRKVHGASFADIIKILSKESLKWVLTANILAWPIAYYFAGKWLDDFAARININLFTFFAVGIVSVLIAFLTVSYQALKSAKAKPIDSLKYE
ncbi:ABC transporter permease [candidate division KSB1 bacterium]